jgi:molybdate transport system permease protein
MDLSPVWLSFRVATLATTIVLVLGLTLIGLATRLKLRFRNLLRMGATLPLVLPPTVLGYYLLVLVGRESRLGDLYRSIFGVDLVFTWQAAVLAAAVASFPLFFMTAMPAFENIDRSILDAARTLGKSEAQIFWLIKLPLAWRGVLGGATLAFSRAIGDFGATLMVAGSIPGKTQTAPLAIYDLVISGDRTGANTLVLITTLIGVLMVFIGTWLFHRRMDGTTGT